MTPRSHRLPVSTRLINSQHYHSPLFTLKYVSSTHLISRIGVVISKKVDKRAAKRNSLRRVVTHQFQEYVNQFIRSYDMLCIIKPQKSEIEESQLKEELVRAFTATKML